MTPLVIAIGTDHRGVALKQAILDHYASDNTVTFVDYGTNTSERTDYPLFAQRVCRAIIDQQADVGILLCASGAGMAIAANRFRGIYAVNAWNSEVAQKAKAHDGCNLLVLPADYIDHATAYDCIDAWRTTEKFSGRYGQRLQLLDAPDFTQKPLDPA